MSVEPSAARGPGDDESTTKRVANEGTQAAGQAAGEVKDTAKQQAQRVGQEARTQVRNVASDVRNRLGERARTQNDNLVSSIRQAADQLEEMRGDRSGSPAATVVTRVADSGRQLADYLERRGPDGVLREVQDFARRRPGAFLATALAAGFLVGRLGKSVAKADADAGQEKPMSDMYYSGGPQTSYPAVSGIDTGSTGYAGRPAAEPTYPAQTTVSTEYASTGTGTPVVVEEDYLLNPPPTSGSPGGAR